MCKIIHGDSLALLPKQLEKFDALITSLPSPNELGVGIATYAEWMDVAIIRCLDAVNPSGVAIFYQTDTKRDGTWYSKAAQIIDVGKWRGHRLLWHKIALRKATGAKDLYRPTYSHMLAFSRRGKVGKALPDVIPAGRFLWKNGMGINAARFMAEYAAWFGKTMVDPFCGQGTAIAAAEALGMHATGIDIDARCCAAARKVSISGPKAA